MHTEEVGRVTVDGEGEAAVAEPDGVVPEHGTVIFHEELVRTRLQP